MRRLGWICCVAVVVGCAKKEAAPAADTTAAAPPAPPMLTAADVAGKWHVRVMGEASDSVLVEYDMTATAGDTGWSIMLPKRPAMTPRVMFSGDSVILDNGPYESVLRKGLQVTTHSVNRLQGGELVGMTTAHYAVKSGDSAVMLRSRATRTP
ncbi:MAG TPA: hypothetical protein VGQ17_12810 [Gemmatimonadales bacterium]|nr:hypothetical protein [Gemmatimonadales bacterium]